MREFEYFHGAVITKLIHGATRPLKIGTASSDNASYLLDDKVGLYLKYSTSRMSPWAFTFTDYQQRSLSELFGQCERTFLLLICNEDGVATVPSGDIRVLLDSEFHPTEWVRVERPPRGSYRVHGNDGSLKRTVPQSDFPGSILRSLGAWPGNLALG